MDIKETTNGILIKYDQHFQPSKIFECGQSFRWKKYQDDYTGVVSGKVLKLKSKEGGYELQNTCINEFNAFWKHYFDLERDYTRINAELSKDEAIKEALHFGSGLRILNQDFWETLISFIISANNNIPRIKGIIEKLSKTYGKKITTDDEEHYAFPTPLDLAKASKEDFLQCGCGYRSGYIKKTAMMVESGDVTFERMKDLSYAEALKLLLMCPGVGNKVADCILLFSAGKTEAFPIDVWIRRAIKRIYSINRISDKGIRSFAHERFGEFAGFAQQYLFYQEISRISGC